MILLGAVYVSMVVVLIGPSAATLESTRLLQNLSPLAVLVNCALIIEIFRSRKITKFQALELLLLFGVIQGLLSILGYFVEPLRDVFQFLYYSSGGDNEFVANARVFGISSDFTYGVQIYHGTLAAVALIFSFEHKRPYTLAGIIILIASVMNGRTGLSIFLTVIVFYVISFVRRNHLRRESLTIFVKLFLLLGGLYLTIRFFASDVFERTSIL
jgi:hypothetical protein